MLTTYVSVDRKTSQAMSPAITLTRTSRDYQSIECFNRVGSKMTGEPVLRLRRRVRFPEKESEVVAMIPLTRPTSKVWYLEAEIETFRSEAASLCSKIRKNRVKLCNMDDNSNDDYCCLRGLELLLSRERQRNQTLAIRTILTAHRNNRSNRDQLAVSARRCTAWAREMARNTAVVDYYRVYMPEAGSFIQPELPSSLSPLSLLKKRLEEKEMNSTTRLSIHTSNPSSSLSKIVDNDR